MDIKSGGWKPSAQAQQRVRGWSRRAERAKPSGLP